MRWCYSFAVAFAAVAPLAAQAHDVERTEYIHYVPLQYPPLIRQTPETVALRLYGDSSAPDYRDIEPRNGVDDRRDRLLRALAIRFSPFLVRNTTAVPMDWKRFMTLQRSFPLFIDHWEMAASPAELVRSDQIDFASLAEAPCPVGATVARWSEVVAAASPGSDDCRLLHVIREFDPDHPPNVWARASALDPDRSPFTVLFFDFPGDNPETWNAEYRGLYSDRLPRKYQGFEKIYVHPFLARGTSGQGGYELVLQYWFFYPWNDAANKHEGDWEHMNVIVAPRSRVDRALGADDVAALLRRGEDSLGGDDPLVIRRVEYFFHDKEMSLDYARPNVYLPRREWQAQVRASIGERIGLDKILEEIRRRAYDDDDEKIVNTHPVGFIGADSKGPELLLAPPGGRNRDGHGTYPFTGLYKEVGPAAASEAIGARFDVRDHARDDPENWPDDVERFDRPERIEMLPDWERVIGLAQNDPQVRREWAWLFLPIRWGYPASDSPFAGVVAHAETGNLSPFGPAYQLWNRTGPAGVERYDPHRFSSMFPLSPLDVIENHLGFLNFGVLLLTSLPPFDLVYKMVLRPVRAVLPPQAAPVFVPTDPDQFRVVGIGIGASTQFMSDANWHLLFFNSAQSDQLGGRLTQSGLIGNFTPQPLAENPTSLVLQIQFFLTPHWVAENTIRHSRSTLGFDVSQSEPPISVPVRASLNLWEWAGSVRYNLLTSRIQPFVKAGYGLSWYRIENVTTSGVPLPTTSSEWVRRPSLVPFRNIFPNTWHYGAGVEFILLAPNAPLTAIGLSLKTEYVMYNHSLGLSFHERSKFNLEADPSIARGSFDVITVLSF